MNAAQKRLKAAIEEAAKIMQILPERADAKALLSNLQEKHPHINPETLSKIAESVKVQDSGKLPSPDPLGRVLTESVSPLNFENKCKILTDIRNAALDICAAIPESCYAQIIRNDCNDQDECVKASPLLDNIYALNDILKDTDFSIWTTNLKVGSLLLCKSGETYGNDDAAVGFCAIAAEYNCTFD